MGYFHYYCHFCRSTKIVDLHLALPFAVSLAKQLHFPAKWGSVFEESFVFLALLAPAALVPASRIELGFIFPEL